MFKKIEEKLLPGKTSVQKEKGKETPLFSEADSIGTFGIVSIFY